MDSDNDDPYGPGFPIRKSTDQSLLAAPRGFSQPTTSFIASRCQGIHQMPLRRLIVTKTQMSDDRGQKTDDRSHLFPTIGHAPAASRERTSKALVKNKISRSVEADPSGIGDQVTGIG